MGSSAATSGQIVVPASRLFVYTLRRPSQILQEVSRDTMPVSQSKVLPAHDNDILFAPARKRDAGHIRCPNAITTRRNAVLLAF
jgi:hypothetical protein